MGMFDSVYVECPICSNSLEFQSKSGNCNLSNFHQNSVPIEVLSGFIRGIEICDVCDSEVKIELESNIKAVSVIGVVK